MAIPQKKLNNNLGLIIHIVRMKPATGLFLKYLILIIYWVFEIHAFAIP